MKKDHTRPYMSGFSIPASFSAAQKLNTSYCIWVKIPSFKKSSFVSFVSLKSLQIWLNCLLTLLYTFLYCLYSSAKSSGVYSYLVCTILIIPWFLVNVQNFIFFNSSLVATLSFFYSCLPFSFAFWDFLPIDEMVFYFN